VLSVRSVRVLAAVTGVLQRRRMSRGTSTGAAMFYYEALVLLARCCDRPLLFFCTAVWRRCARSFHSV
jgi:hypothetical protein